MHLRLSLLLLVVTVLLTSSLPLPQRPPGEPSECALSLVALSPCLPYIAGPPTHPTPAPSVICCGTFYQAIVNAGPSCMCYLMRDPLILGFPIDTGRLVAMVPSCRVNNTSSAICWLYDTCQVTEIEALSPLSSIAPGPAATVNSSSDDQWGQGYPTPAKSIAPCRIERHHFWGSLFMIWLLLSINFLI